MEAIESAGRASADLGLPRRRKSQGVDPELQALIDLCLNNLDGYSALLFVADRAGGPLRLRVYRSLSMNLNTEIQVFPGQGLVGWAYKTGRAVNVDQVSFASDRLLFYDCDENIKSFMAVPLPDICGVLAVDSKQRYIFTDKSAKLMAQFGQSTARVWRRLFGKPAITKTSGEGQAGPDPGEAPENEICALWQGLEFCLSRSDHEGGGLGAALELIGRFSGLSWAFLTAVKNSDEKYYHLVAARGNVPENLPSKFPMASGLAGWLHTKLKPLSIDRLKADSRNSFIFQKTEAIKGFRSFYGWPVLYNDQPRGSLILAGAEGETLDPALAEVLECVVARLAAQFHLDRLINKVMEMDEIDSQTGLAHRGHFVDEVRHMMEVADFKGEGVDLFVLATSGLGAFAAENGQEAAGELIKSIARQLKDSLRPTWRLGHVSYGLFTLASPSAEAAEVKSVIAKFKKSLENWPLPGSSGRADLGLFPALAAYPQDGDSPELLLETALTALAEADDEEE
ncbi:MAG: GAF domain-containing protein [Candidatus Adiutrix sp.]|jgi:GGDEF domain-containing protein|nr:GAF domain-containing protein [Candidatus Adiutrix sp.]